MRFAGVQAIPLRS